MDMQKNNGHAAPATDEADETMSLFGEKLDAATPCAADAATQTREKADSQAGTQPREESQSELRNKA